MENLRNLCIRLIITGLVLFIFTELLMAHIAVFYFIPQMKIDQAMSNNTLLRIAVEEEEYEDYFSLIAEGESKEISHELLSLNNGLQGISGIQNSQYDVICTDALSASYLNHNNLANAFIFKKNSKNDVAIDRLVLVGHETVPEFLLQTKGLSLVLTGNRGSLSRIVADKFLSYKLENIDTWFSKVNISQSSKYALERLETKKADLALIKESDFRKLYPGEASSIFKVIWYSEPFPQKIVLLRKGLNENAQNYVKDIFANGKGHKAWGRYDESLVTLDDWEYRISGKKFMYNDKVIEEWLKNE